MVSISIRKILINARQFDLISDEIERIDFEQFHALSALVVNSSLTCELYLKALGHITQSKLFKGHDLVKLYQLQLSDVQTAIFEKYKTLYLSRDVPDYLIGTMTKQLFMNDLSEFKDIFMDWRYVYEFQDESVRAAALSMMRRALRSVTSDYHDDKFH